MTSARLHADRVNELTVADADADADADAALRDRVGPSQDALARQQFL
jgi:hypothetical protein